MGNCAKMRKAGYVKVKKLVRGPDGRRRWRKRWTKPTPPRPIAAKPAPYVGPLPLSLYPTATTPDNECPTRKCHGYAGSAAPIKGIEVRISGRNTKLISVVACAMCGREFQPYEASKSIQELTDWNRRQVRPRRW